MSLSFGLVYIRSTFSKNRNEYINNYYRRQGMVIGEDVHIFCELMSREPYLIKIGNNVTISTDVKFLTHDASMGTLCGREKISDICGEINVGDNTFIGAGSILMYGVTIGERCIIGAGSVVTKSIPDGEIWGGNPARKIGETDEFVKKNSSFGLQLHGLNMEERKKAILNGSLKCR